MTQKIPSMVADVTVVGAGIIALSTAVALADRNVSVRLIGTTHKGGATPASAGMLTPTIEEELRAVYEFALASRDMYPDFLASLEARTQIPVPLNRLGALHIATTEQEVETLRTIYTENEERGGAWLDHKDVSDLEPALSHAHGAILMQHDGCVDPPLLLDALRLAVARHENIDVINEDGCNIDVSQDTCEVTTNQAGRFASRQVILAAGAWTPALERSGTTLPIEPVRGQMLAYEARPLRHVTYGPKGYLVPKADGHTLAGSTFERVGFDATTTEPGLAQVRASGETICPSLADAPIHATWAGLRPVTPDMLPIIGPDPASPNIIFACGHSRNGILLAPLTAEVVADLVTNIPPRYDLHRFRPERF